MRDALDEVDILTQWAFAGLAIGLTMLAHLLMTTWLCYRDGKSDTCSLAQWQLRFFDHMWWMHAALPLYMLHEFEEHGIDLLGNRYAFQGALCEAMGTPDVDECPGTPLIIFFVNVGTVWIGGTLARYHALGPGLNFYGTVAMNAMIHLVSFIAKGFKYNPGLLTSILLFLPAAYMMVRSLHQAGRCDDSDVVRALLVGVVIHAVIITSMLSFKFGYVSEGQVCFIQLLNVLPLFIR